MYLDAAAHCNAVFVYLARNSGISRVNLVYAEAGAAFAVAASGSLELVFGATGATCSGVEDVDGIVSLGESFFSMLGVELGRLLVDDRRSFSSLLAALTSATPLATLLAAPAKPPTTYPPAATPLASSTPPPVTIPYRTATNICNQHRAASIKDNCSVPPREPPQRRPSPS